MDATPEPEQTRGMDGAPLSEEDWNAVLESRETRRVAEEERARVAAERENALALAELHQAMANMAHGATPEAVARVHAASARLTATPARAAAAVRPEPTTPTPAARGQVGSPRQLAGSDDGRGDQVVPRSPSVVPVAGPAVPAGDGDAISAALNRDRATLRREFEALDRGVALSALVAIARGGANAGAGRVRVRPTDQDAWVAWRTAETRATRLEMILQWHVEDSALFDRL
jgi:hypothetical protein